MLEAVGHPVAVNPDPQAPIFQYARFGILHDGLEIVAELDKAMRALGPPG